MYLYIIWDLWSNEFDDFWRKALLLEIQHLFDYSYNFHLFDSFNFVINSGKKHVCHDYWLNIMRHDSHPFLCCVNILKMKSMKELPHMNYAFSQLLGFPRVQNHSNFIVSFKKCPNLDLANCCLFFCFLSWHSTAVLEPRKKLKEIKNHPKQP